MTQHQRTHSTNTLGRLRRDDYLGHRARQAAAGNNKYRACRQDNDPTMRSQDTSASDDLRTRDLVTRSDMMSALWKQKQEK